MYVVTSTYVERIMHIVRPFLDALENAINEEDKYYLKQCFALNKCPEIDYDRYAVSFTYLYFLENFSKASAIFSQEPLPLVRRMADIGCGSGASTIAYLAALNNSLSQTNSRLQIDVTLIDRSEQQLDLAKQLIELVEDEFKHLNIVLHIQKEDFYLLNPIGEYDCVLVGHFLTENVQYAQQFLEKCFLIASDNCRIYVIERKKEEDPEVWRSIENSAPQLALPISYRETEVEPGLVDFNSFPQIASKAQIACRYMVIQVPEQKQLVEFLRLYFRAWETQSVQLLDRIFAPEAKYYDKPLKDPLDGLNQIREYWRENVLKQRDISVRILDVAYSANKVIAEWEASFVKSNFRVHIFGFLSLKTDPGLRYVVALHESYESSKTEV